MEHHVGGGVAQPEVALGHSGLAQVETGLVSSEPTLRGQLSRNSGDWREYEPQYLLTHNSRGVDSGEGEVHVGGDHGGLVLVLRLEAA